MATSKATQTAAPPAATPQHPFAATLKTFRTASGRTGAFYSLPQLAATHPNVRRLPVSLRIVLESVLRNCDGIKVTPEHVEQLAGLATGCDAQRGDPVRRRPRRAAGFHRRAACSSIWRRCAMSPPRWAAIRRRSSRWCRSIWWSTTA